jgi:hypothetical protein
VSKKKELKKLKKNSAVYNLACPNCGTELDFYTRTRIQQLTNPIWNDPAYQHLMKKLERAGMSHKTLLEDLRESQVSLEKLIKYIESVERKKE